MGATSILCPAALTNNFTILQPPHPLPPLALRTSGVSKTLSPICTDDRRAESGMKLPHGRCSSTNSMKGLPSLTRRAISRIASWNQALLRSGWPANSSDLLGSAM